MSEGRTHRLRAILRNAATWGIAWAVVGGTLSSVITLVNPGPGIDALADRLGAAVLSAITYGVRFGIAGSVIGTAFASLIRLGYKGRRLADISPLRFAALGAVVGGAGVPLFLQTMNVLSGDGPVAWRLVLDDAGWATVFGAAAAAGSILIARRADARSPRSSSAVAERPHAPGALPAAGHREASFQARSRSMER